MGVVGLRALSVRYARATSRRTFLNVPLTGDRPLVD